MNWGILGYGKIAPVFIESLRHIGTEQITAVASKSKSDGLHTEFPDAKIYDDYDDIYSDPNVDIIYISTTHNFHAEQSVKALRNGKHVLCEKPIGVNYKETKLIIQEARSSGRFFMEAMWTRFLPAYRKFKEILSENALGKIKLVKAEFAFKTESSPEGRLLNPRLAGGALLDIGVYPISLINDIFLKFPEKLHVDTEMSMSGVDLGFAAQMQYSTGVIAQIFCSLGVTTINNVLVYGEKGWLCLDSSYKVQKVIMNIDSQEKVFDLPYLSTGFVHEIEEVITCMQNNEKQSKIFSWEDSLKSAEMVDIIRREMLT